MSLTTLVEARLEFDRLCPVAVCPVLTTGPIGHVVTATVNNGGADYEVNDLLTLFDDVTLLVLTVDAGAVLAVSIVNAGEGHADATAQAATGGAGTGATFDITVAPESEVDRILKQWQWATVWEAETAYSTGAVVATVENGHRYRLIVPGTSGATEPVWPTGDDSTVIDGTAAWREDGSDWGRVLWEFQGAASDGWNLKAAKSVTSVDTRAGQVSISGSQLYEHCKDQAARFQSLYVL